MRPNWLTGYGLSNLEALLILVAMGVLAVGVWWWIRHRWRNEARWRESAIVEARHQCDQLRGDLGETERQRDQLQSELTITQQQDEQVRGKLAETQRQIEQLQREVNEVRAKYDPIRIRELQDEFHTEIAHEFATELDSFVQGCKTTADKLKADQVDLRVLQNALRSKADNMKQHCKNIVGLERLDRIPFTLQPVNLVGLIQEVVADLVDTCGDFRGVRFELPPPPRLPTIWVNKSLIGEVFRNVFRNAVNASGSGDVVEITVRLEDGDPRKAIVDVHDSGRVIPPELQAQLFELHRRGVGLPYSLKIARLHKGDVILVWSKPGEGTLFRIILPYGEPGEPPSPEEETDSAPPDKPSESLTPDKQRDSVQPGNHDAVSSLDAAPEGETP